MDSETKERLHYFLKIWLQETIFLCTNYIEKDIYSDRRIKSSQRNIFREHYILTSTVMSIRFAKKLVDHSKKQLKLKIEHFIKSTRDAVDVRDMREHSDEYFIGKGRKQDQFFKGSPNRLICDMSSSIGYKNGEYMLGNLISIEHIRRECKKLLDVLNYHYK